MITINGYKFADIGYYINLDRRIDRKDNIEKQFNTYNIHGVERHSANTETNSTPLNCKISHYELYRKFLSSDSDSLLVLEDDCLFLPYIFNETKEIYNNLIDTEFDIFWLGCKNRRTPRLYKNKLYQVQSVSHAQSYIIKRKFCKHIIDNYPVQSHNSLAIDELLCLAPFGYEVSCDPNKFSYYQMDNPIDDLKTYFLSLCYERSLTTQYSSYSDLTEVEVNYESYITSSFPVS
jgi:GR25 family glycosyltransferase involved in LPS biosynthesis